MRPLDENRFLQTNPFSQVYVDACLAIGGGKNKIQMPKEGKNIEMYLTIL